MPTADKEKGEILFQLSLKPLWSFPEHQHYHYANHSYRNDYASYSA
jgi:hypothetical protein